MIKSAGFFCCIILISIFGLFQIKYKVQNLRKDLTEIQRQILQEKEEIHVLKAEWTYLNQPDRLKRLADQYLKLKPMQVIQMQKLKGDLPEDWGITAKEKQDAASGNEEQAIVALLEQNNNFVKKNVKWNYKTARTHQIFAHKTKHKIKDLSKVNYNKQ